MQETGPFASGTGETSSPVDRAAAPSGNLLRILSSDRARVLLDLDPSALIVIDTRGTVLAYSRSAEGIFGHPAQDVLGQNIAMLMPAQTAARHDGFLDRYRQTGEKRIIGDDRVETALHRDGHMIPIELRINAVEVEGEQCFIGFVRRIGGEAQPGAMKSLLAELAQTSRVAAMGALATAIAHELNQPLTTIANYTQGLRNLIDRREDFEGREEFVRILEKCSAQAVRAGQLLHRLREFVKGGKPHAEPVSIEHLVRESTALAMINGFRRTIHIGFDLAPGLPRVLVDPLQGQQVLFNLLRNAIEAVDTEQGGRHEVRIAARETPAGMVEISVEDEGPGIAPEIADTLFESFVTTKGGGMGVGLAICRQIIEAHGGSIFAEASAELGGAAFRFTLPAVSEG